MYFVIYKKKKLLLKYIGKYLFLYKNRIDKMCTITTTTTIAYLKRLCINKTKL